jgi:hypothetical protein
LYFENPHFADLTGWQEPGPLASVLLKLPIAVICCLSLSLGCGAPPGEVACGQFKQTVIDWRQGDLNTFEFRDNLSKVQEKAASAEPEIKTAAATLFRSANTLSEDRLEVSIDIMGEACVELGYLDEHTF